MRHTEIQKFSATASMSTPASEKRILLSLHQRTGIVPATCMRLEAVIPATVTIATIVSPLSQWYSASNAGKTNTKKPTSVPN